jgi:AAA15 family ATPase/GTPase
MKLIGFKIQNIKSIQDTGWCYLSENDNITVFAGQNEAGKSAVLEGLNFFRNGTTEDFERLSKRIDKPNPCVECEFFLDDEDRQGDSEVISVLKKIDKATLFRGGSTKEEYSTIQFSQEFSTIIDEKIENLLNDKKTIDNKAEKNVDEVSNSETSEIVADSPVKPELNANDLKKLVIQHINNHLPTFIYYDSFVNILPGTVKLNKIDEYPAIQDLQKVFKINFSETVRV